MRKVKFRYEEWYDDVCTAGDNGQSEIWLEVDGKELTPRRRLATKEIINVTRHHCTSEAFQAFYSEYHIAVGKVTRLDLSDLDVVAMELRLAFSPEG